MTEMPFSTTRPKEANQMGGSVRQVLGNGAAVALIAGATMGLELVQTKVLSFLYYNHVVYLTITIVLLGFGMSGPIAAMSCRRRADLSLLSASLTAGFAMSIP